MGLRILSDCPVKAQDKANQASHPGHLYQPRTFQRKSLPLKELPGSSPSVPSRDQRGPKDRDYLAAHLPGWTLHVTSPDHQSRQETEPRTQCVCSKAPGEVREVAMAGPPTRMSPQCPRGSANAQRPLLEKPPAAVVS